MHDLTRNAPSTDDLDKAFRAALGKMTGGLSTLPYTNAWADWAHQLSNSPGRQSELQQDAIARTLATFQFAARAMSGQPVPPNEGLPGAPDSRYAAPAWSQYPFNVWAHAFQQGAGWWQSLNQGVDGLPSSQADLVGFTVQQWLEALAPANFLASNPELLELTRAEGGENLRRGLQNYLEDTGRTMKGLGPVGTEGFQLGVNIAATPGKVVLQNELIELIQYSPTTADVYAEPILIVPAWIMKYYILDLSAKNSLVKYLVDQGHTVFMVSWKNPQPSDRDCDMDTYLKLGLRASLAAVSALVPEQKIHTVGYCIGGTLLAIGAAALGRENDHRIASVTLLAAQTDFSEPGELSLFINPSQLAMLEAKMREEGVLDSKQMGGAFQMLRPRDLI